MADLEAAAPQQPLSMLEKVLVLEAVMLGNRCEDAMCADWYGENCVCRIEFEEMTYVRP